MTEESTGELNDNAARAMLNCFASVGASHFDMTATMRNGEKDWFRRNVPLAELTHTLPGMLNSAISSERNVIVRPHGPGITFLQLGDLTAGRLPALAPAVFLALETSPGNFQAWLALPGSEDKEFARRMLRDNQNLCTATISDTSMSSIALPEQTSVKPEAAGRRWPERPGFTEVCSGRT